MSPPVLVAIIAAIASLLNMFFSVFVVQWVKRRNDAEQERIEEERKRAATAVESRASEAEQLRLDRETMRREMREDMDALRVELETERKERRACHELILTLEQRIRDLEHGVAAAVGES